MKYKFYGGRRFFGQEGPIYSPGQKEIFQKIFEFVFNTLIEQGVPSRGPNPRNESVFESGDQVCLYRGVDGLKCAVGHLIDDEFYDKSLENHTAAAGDVWVALTKSIRKNFDFDLPDGYGDFDKGFFGDLQIGHDECLKIGVTTYRRYMREMADSYMLDCFFMEGNPNV